MFLSSLDHRKPPEVFHQQHVHLSNYTAGSRCSSIPCADQKEITLVFEKNNKCILEANGSGLRSSLQQQLSNLSWSIF
jgi:hypothetical protein